MTAKVGPLPVWAWALAILVVGYLIYRHSSSSPSSTSASDTSSTDNSTPAPPDTSGTPGPDNTGGGSSTGGAGDGGNLNDELLSQLSGFGNSIDALTSAVLTSEAFLPGSGDSGSGSIVPNGSTPLAPAKQPAATSTGAHGGTTKTTTTAAKTKPAPTLVSEHGQGGGFTPTTKPAQSTNVHYYTYAPGKAPKGQKANEAPASVPGKTLHFAAGRGYYYA